MLDAVIRFSLRNRALVVVLSLAVLLYGGYLTARLPIDVLPDLDRPRVVLITECAGLAAEEVEALVSQPIETAVLGAAGVRDVRSEAVTGLSVVHVVFDWEAASPWRWASWSTTPSSTSRTSTAGCTRTPPSRSRSRR